MSGEKVVVTSPKRNWIDDLRWSALVAGILVQFFARMMGVNEWAGIFANFATVAILHSLRPQVHLTINFGASTENTK